MRCPRGTPWMTQTRWGQCPRPELLDECLLLVRREPAGDQHDARRDLATVTRSSIQRQRALLVAQTAARRGGRSAHPQRDSCPSSIAGSLLTASFLSCPW